MSFEYDEFLLRVVTDPLGRKFTFSYDPMNRLRVLRDETGGREVHYSYTDNADLFEVDLALGGGFVSSADYRYLGADFPVDLQHNLTQIINADGEVAVENEYGTDPGLPEFNKVVRHRSDDGEFEYEY